MQAVLRNVENQDGFTLLLLAAILLLILAKWTNTSRFYNFLALPFNNKYIGFYSKKDKLNNGFQWLFSLFQLINISVFATLSLRLMGGYPSQNNLSVLLMISGIVGTFLLAKAFLQLAAGYVFEQNALITELIFNKQSYYNHSGLVLFVANITLLYTSNGSYTVFYVVIFLFLLINFLGYLNLLRMYQNLFGNYIFYFILYLCALEIAPLVILGSYVKG